MTLASLALPHAARVLRGGGFLALLIAAVVGAAAAADGIVDQGSFTVTSAGRVVGTEEFNIEAVGDSVAGYSSLLQFHGGPGEADTLLKRAGFILNSLDYGLRWYKSGFEFRGRTLQRWVQVYDTTFSSYRQAGREGSANIHRLPPGKVFVLDPFVYTNFDILCLNLKDRVFQTRPITMIVLTPDQDSVITATAADAGAETIRWGGRPVQTRHITLSDGGITYDMWMGPDGKLLRLEHVPTQLRVERVAPPLKARRPAPKRGG